MKSKYIADKRAAYQRRALILPSQSAPLKSACFIRMDFRKVLPLRTSSRSPRNCCRFRVLPIHTTTTDPRERFRRVSGKRVLLRPEIFWAPIRSAVFIDTSASFFGIRSKFDFADDKLPGCCFYKAIY
ncbi:hypothetical protein BV898_11405 [Hypsibius exemplaris]|uniref:Uncharacterized protein n=1 Tax=Hypsibius exemplaris TaxID=2072580 RepID=A0A1W0WGV0_HYPEX|nr:hypothetical protein BV898_11405 [Hypsibius exemplaris]